MITAAVSSARVGRARGRRASDGHATGLRFSGIAVLGFHVMLSGDGWLITEDAEPVAVRPGDVVFTASGAEHGFSRAPARLADLPAAVLGDFPPPPVPVDFEFLCGSYPLDGGKVPPLLRHLPSVLAFTPDYEHHPELRVVVELLAADYADPGPGTDLTRAALIDLMIVHILRHLQERAAPSDWPLTTEPGIADALREIHEHPERRWSVQQLSDVAAMSRTTFVRRFSAAIGTPPMAYLIEWRLGSAAQLLRQSDAPLATIARKVGYSTEFAFAAAFRRRYGVPPGRYRAADAAPALA